jgi:Tfp pilus assembly protein PilV
MYCIIKLCILKEGVEMKTNNIMNNDKGLSLIEVLLSVTILGFIFISIMGFFSQAYDYTERNESKTVGINVARNVLYYMERQDFERLQKKYLDSSTTKELTKSNCNDQLGDEDVFVGNCSQILETVVNNVTYSATVTIENHKDPNLKSYLIPLKVRVNWSDQETTVEGVIRNE